MWLLLYVLIYLENNCVKTEHNNNDPKTNNDYI